jgi:hypothetical protein
MERERLRRGFSSTATRSSLPRRPRASTERELLIEGGFTDSVLAQRLEFQQAIEPVFCAAVERVSGLRVVSFASITKLDPNYSAKFSASRRSTPRT